MRPTICALLALFAAACGPTVGDACTTNTECLGQVCLNTDYAPGGYCSLSCKLDEPNTCPTGTLCVQSALGKNSPGCMRTCRSAADCRAGYVCRTENDSASQVCVGATGL